MNLENKSPKIELDVITMVAGVVIWLIIGLVLAVNISQSFAEVNRQRAKQQEIFTKKQEQAKQIAKIVSINSR